MTTDSVVTDRPKKSKKQKLQELKEEFTPSFSPLSYLEQRVVAEAQVQVEKIYGEALALIAKNRGLPTNAKIKLEQRDGVPGLVTSEE